MNPINRIAYYRLRSVDIDGKEKLSRIVAVTSDDKNKQLQLVSNPVHDKIVLLASQQLEGPFNYRISMMNGQLVQQGNLVLQSGATNHLELKKYMNPGVYTLEVTNGAENFHYKIMVQ